MGTVPSERTIGPSFLEAGSSLAALLQATANSMMAKTTGSANEILSEPDRGMNFIFKWVAGREVPRKYAKTGRGRSKCLLVQHTPTMRVPMCGRAHIRLAGK